MSSRNLIKCIQKAGIGSLLPVVRCQRLLTMSAVHGTTQQYGTCASSDDSGEVKASDQEDTEMPFIVGHDKKKKYFYINIEKDGKRRKESAILEYSWIRPDFVDLYHTEVPPAYRGQGIAKVLAKAALEHFVQEDVKMKLSCTYLHKYVLDTRLPRVWDHVCWDD